MSRITIFIALTFCCIVAAFFVPPIPQDPAYHQFADSRAFFGIPNFYNVISNIPFIVIGIFGLLTFFKRRTFTYATVSRVTLFAGVVLIGFGSGYYHWQPSNFSLVWDRIPMTIVFMSFFAIVVETFVDVKWGRWMLIPSIIIGAGSVLLWYYGELVGRGDLRLYALIQFYPMIAIPLILFLFPASRRMRLEMIAVIALYVVAKVFEHEDEQIFQALTISGHSLKHIFAAAAVLIISKMVGDEASPAPLK